MKVFSTIICLVFLLGAFPVLSQTFDAGLIGGFNLTQLDGDKLGGFNKIGFNAGGRVAADFSDRWALSWQLLYSQQGSSRARDDDPNSIYDKIRLNFVEAPLLLHFTDWKLQLDAGVSYARLINFKVIDFTGLDISDNQQYRSNIFSAVVGVTFWSNETIGWNFRWTKALNNLQAVAGNGRLIGRNISLRLYYML